MSEAMRMTRQQLLKRGGVAALGLTATGALLQACGGGSDGTTAVAGDETVSPAEARRRLAAATGSVKGLYWEGYDLGTLPRGVKVNAAPMAAIEDPINKKGTYDVGVNVSGLFPQQNQAGVMSPLDLDLVPSLTECVKFPGLVDPNGTPKFATIDGTPYGVGHLWSPFIITYLRSEVKPVGNLEELLEPEYRGRFGIGDDATSAIMMVSSELGLGAGGQPGRLTPDEFDQVFAKLEEFKEAAKGIIANPYGEYASQYGRGEIVAAFPDYSGTVATAQRSGVDVAESLPGASFSYADTWFLGSGGGSDADYAFLNANIAEVAQRELGLLFTSGVFNAKAMDTISSKVALYRDPEEVLAKAPMREWPPLESDEFVTYGEWSKRWQELKV